MPRFKLKIQYDGTEFAGWQIQKDKRTVQGILEDSLMRFNEGRQIKVTGAGRTDAGVHAFGQVAHFDLETRLDTCELKKALNAVLPEDIKAMELDAVSARFHARYSAIRRQYNYQIFTGNSILIRNQAWLQKPFDLVMAQAAADKLIGIHDFTSFAKKNPDLDHYVCEIYYSTWIKNDDMVIYSIHGNRFLHHMVRYLTGTMVAIAKGVFSLEEFEKLLNEPSENVCIHKAPSRGLILNKVIYED